MHTSRLQSLPGGSMLFFWIMLAGVYGFSAPKKDKYSTLPIDSVKFMAYHGATPAIRYSGYMTLATRYRFDKSDSSYFFSKKALSLSRSLGYKQEEDAHATMILGFISKLQIDSVWAHMHTVMLMAGRVNDSTEYARVHFTFANMYEEMRKRDSSLYHYLLAVAYAKNIKDHIVKATMLHGLAQYYMRQGDYDKALPYMIEAYNERYRKDSLEITGLMSDLGNIYFHKKDFAKAMIYYRKSLQECHDKNAWWAYGYTFNNIGLVYEEQDSFDLAEESYKNSLKFYRTDGNKAGTANTSGNLARLYFHHENNDSALKYALYAVEAGHGTSDMKVIYDNYHLLSDIYEAMGDYRKSLINERIAGLYNDSLHSAEAREKTTDLQIQYETSEKETENARLKQKAAEEQLYGKRQTQITILVSTLFCLSLFVLYIIYRSNRQQHSLNREINRQKEEIEQTSEFKTRLFSIISHDFRSPLTSLNGFLYLIKEDMLDKQELLDMSKAMQEQLNTTSAFLDNMLFWAQTQLAGYKAFIHKVNLRVTVIEIFDLYANAAFSKSDELKNEVSEDLEFEADGNLVRMVLRNLVSNAIKFTEHGEVKVSASASVNEVVVCVSDTGIGVPDEMLQNLFSSIRHTRTGTQNEKGTGLGLSLCREFIEAAGGRMWAERNEGKGSSFYFSLPLTPLS